MPYILLERPVLLPVATLQTVLSQILPMWRWRVGDEVGAATLSLDRPSTILGMAGPDILMMAIERVDRPLPLEIRAPPHQLHIILSQPSTDDQELARRLLLLTAAGILKNGPGSAQLADHGPWYASAELGAAAAMLARDPINSRVDMLLARSGEQRASAAPAPDRGYQPPPPGSPAERMMMSDLEHSFAKILTEVGGAEFAKSMGHAPPPPYAAEEPRADRLPTFVLALAHPLEFDWSPLMDIGRMDSPGGWSVQPGPNGNGVLTGRGTTVRIEAHPDPIPGYILENALARSFWFTGGRAALARQASSLIVTCDLNTRDVPFDDVRETAKVMTLLLGLLTRTPGCLALLNNGVHTLLDPAMVQSQVGHLHKNQIPLMLWTWTAPDSMVRDAVSLTSGGLLPFLGFEVEVWNAPGEPDWVGDKMGKIINYLLHVGPGEVHDGDSFGEVAGDRSIRGFFGTTNAQRADTSIKVLLLEFSGPGAARPAPDPTPAKPAGPGGFGRRLFGRKT
jgi:hypothetical protein